MRTFDLRSLIVNDKFEVMKKTLFQSVMLRHIQFDTVSGVLRSYGTLKEIERNLPDGFFRINNQTIVNLSFVTHVDGDKTVVAGRTFSISRGRRREFLSALHLSDMMK